MRKGKLPALLVAVALLGLIVIASGCGSQAPAQNESKLTQEQYAKIEKGMTADQLKSMAGEPSRKEAKNSGGGHSMGDGSSMGSSMAMEYWYYQGDKGWVRLEVTDGKVSAKSGY